MFVHLFADCGRVFRGWSQTAPAAHTTPKAAPAKKPAPATAKPAAATPARPTAIIETTAGKLTCTLFPDVAPMGVANFIGLAQGTKDWTNPISHAKKHGVPLYDGTIFHRVIPNFMIQGGDPAGSGSGDIGFEFKNETSPTVKFDRPGVWPMPTRSGHQRLPVLHHRGSVSQPEWRIHPVRPMRRAQHRTGEADRAHRVAMPTTAPTVGQDRLHIVIAKGGAAPAAKPHAATHGQAC